MPSFLYVALTILISATSAKVSTKEITYAVATRNNPDLKNFITPIDVSKISKERPVVFIIHDWMQNGQKSWIQNLTRVLLKNSDCSVISVDWKKPANGSYPSTVEKVPKVGKIVGDAVVSLVKIDKIPLNNFHVIGHSLGAHVAGFAAQRLKSKLRKPLPWVTGLDPARPLYEAPEKVPNSQRLSDDDAVVVEVVHTDGAILGFKSSIGTIDFYPNGGEYIQPNCTSLNSEKRQNNYISCSHEKSCQYYTKALSQHGYTAIECSSWTSYKNGGCRNGDHATFGGLEAPKQKGDFYLEITAPEIYI